VSKIAFKKKIKTVAVGNILFLSCGFGLINHTCRRPLKANFSLTQTEMSQIALDLDMLLGDYT
jgi:hypothetical protein